VYPVATVGLLGGLWLLRRRIGKGLFTALLHFYIATSFLVLVQVLYMMRYTFVSDHWQYFGCLSVVAVMAAGIDLAFDFVGRGRSYLKPAFCGALLLTLGVLTWRQCGMYRDMDTLWRVTLARNPNCWMAHNNWGVALARQGNLEEAVQHLERTLQLKPDYADAHNNLGGVLAKQHKVAEAIQCYEQALGYNPAYAEAHCNLGVALAAQGKLAEAIQHFERAVQLKPGYAEAHCYLGIAFAGQGRPAEAAAQFEQALDLATAQGNSRLAESIRARRQAIAVPAGLQPQPNH
jgi:tetratricopeptide (TPR) repeat protein